MKSKILIILLGIMPFIVSAQGQEDDSFEGKKEKIESMRVGFITQKLSLTTEEAKIFWPVYNQYHQELQKLRKSKRMERQGDKNNFETLSDKEIEKIVDGEIIFRQSELDISKKYHSQFKQILPIKKVGLLYKAEQDFKRELLKQIREGKHQNK